jgi:hypothetical protein
MNQYWVKSEIGDAKKGNSVLEKEHGKVMEKWRILVSNWPLLRRSMQAMN